MADLPRRRKLFKVAIGVTASLVVLSFFSWFVGPAGSEEAVVIRLGLTAVAFMALVGSIIGLLVTDW